MKRTIVFILTLLVVLLCACATAATDSELEALKKSLEEKEAQIVQLQDEIQEKDNLLKKFEPFTLTSYTVVPFKKGFVINQDFVWVLPRHGSLNYCELYQGTVIDVLVQADVKGEMWLFVRVPVFGDPHNDVGWVRESDIVPYTQDKIKDVKSPVEIKANSTIYNCDEFSDIATAEQVQFDYKLRVPLHEKRDGYVKISYSDMNGWVKEEALIYPEVVD